MKNTHLKVNAADDFRQMDLFQEGERILEHARLEAPSIRSAWYEIFLIEIKGGFIIEAHAGDRKRRTKESWFRRKPDEALQKYIKILKDKLNPERRSPRKYVLVNLAEQAAA